MDVKVISAWIFAAFLITLFLLALFPHPTFIGIGMLFGMALILFQAYIILSSGKEKGEEDDTFDDKWYKH